MKKDNIKIRIESELKEIFREKAKSCGLTLSEYVRRIVKSSIPEVS
jgi:antitoxin component of RelBE/YafQ-DinJ toxin-antitoxin module